MSAESVHDYCGCGMHLRSKRVHQSARIAVHDWTFVDEDVDWAGLGYRTGFRTRTRAHDLHSIFGRGLPFEQGDHRVADDGGADRACPARARRALDLCELF